MKKFVKTLPSVSWYLEGEKQTEVLKRPLLEILDKLSSDTQLAVNFEIPHGDEVESVLDRRINVYVWGSPLSDTATISLDAIVVNKKKFELSDGQKDSWDFSRIADIKATYTKPIMDDNKKIIAVVDNNNIFISFDLFHGTEAYDTRGKEVMNIFRFIITEATKHIVTDKNKIERLIDEMPLLGYVKGIIENSSKMQEKKKKELVSVEASITSILRNIVVEQRRYNDIQKTLQLNFDETSEARLLEKNRNALVGLLKNGYTSIQWAGNTLKAKTEVIPIVFKDKTFLLGGYEITISIDGKIAIKNKKNPKDGYDHPHIRGGLPCYGNVGASIGKLIAQLEFLPILDMLLPYLRAYNPKDSYAKLGLWAPDSESVCSDCGEIEECCRC